MKKYTFEEFICYGLGYRAAEKVALTDVEMRDEMPWHFRFHGIPVSQENKDMYVLTPVIEPYIHFKRGQFIRVDDAGKVSVSEPLINKPELKILNQLEHPVGTRFLLVQGGCTIHTPREASVVAWSGSFTFVKLRVGDEEHWYNPVTLRLIVLEVLKK